MSDQDWRTGLRVLWSSVGGIYMSQLSGFASRNGGNLIVSLLLGPANLAFYSRAFSFLVGPLQQAQMALNPLMLRDAADARIQGQTEPYLAKLVPRLFALMLPVSAAIGAMGTELTLLLLGPAWAQAGELMTISAGLAISMTIALPARWILVASRDSRKLRIDSLLQFSLLGGCAIGAALWGLQGSMIINAVLLGPVIAVADWMLLSPTARAFFWRRALPIAVSLFAIPFLFVTVAKAVTNDSLQTVVLGLVAGAVTTAVAFAIFERDRLRAATSRHKTEGQ